MLLKLREEDPPAGRPDPSRYAALADDLRVEGARHGVRDVLAVSTADICVAQWVRLKCKYGCKRYGSSWCCAPETPSPEQARAVLDEYRTALLLFSTTRNADFHRENARKRRRQVQLWKGIVALERRLFLSGYYKAFALVSETCALCRECSYPDACRFPNDRRPSVESFAIDVFQTLKNVGRGFRVATNVAEEHDSYSVILLE